MGPRPNQKMAAHFFTRGERRCHVSGAPVQTIGQERGLFRQPAQQLQHQRPLRLAVASGLSNPASNNTPAMIWGKAARIRRGLGVSPPISYLIRTEHRFATGLARFSIQSRLQTGAPLYRHFVRTMKYASELPLISIASPSYGLIFFETSSRRWICSLCVEFASAFSISTIDTSFFVVIFSTPVAGRPRTVR